MARETRIFTPPYLSLRYSGIVETPPAMYTGTNNQPNIITIKIA